MTEITFHPLSEIPPPELLALLTDPNVRRHMPLAGDDWNADSAAEWARAKDAQWQENGYGPWAIRIDGGFAGWGGFQKEGDEADLGLVLFPGQWGHGAAIFRELVRRGTELQVRNVTIMLPPSRVRLKGLVRLGFEPAGELDYAGQRFLKFRRSGS
ncbi:MAG TPA: GNAT family protein [Devosia sp.]|jgi:RimJ/RimL family protein N-acetyltransferase|uniref:GNAT family N-acetyltransferase n=1 Tax=Devosia sp. TaxID=1871048 RepID=UPI002DDD1326|nr:GNAT family protein [Devosia sp.]HEV2513800.1 GNAT family protein [Devosia sp.]